MTKVNLDIRTWHNNDGEESDEPYSYRGTTSGSIDRIYIVRDDDGYSWGYRGYETDLEPPFFVVYADYYTGDTFGTDYDATIVGIVKTDEEAIDLVREAREKSGFGELSNGFYVPWNGYFESLIGVYSERVS